MSLSTSVAVSAFRSRSGPAAGSDSLFSAASDMMWLVSALTILMCKESLPILAKTVLYALPSFSKRAQTLGGPLAGVQRPGTVYMHARPL
jgi:hypothetical protein